MRCVVSFSGSRTSTLDNGTSSNRTGVNGTTTTDGQTTAIGRWPATTTAATVASTAGGVGSSTSGGGGESTAAVATTTATTTTAAAASASATATGAGAATETATATTTTTTVRPTFYDVNKGTGYDGGNRYGAGYDERDGETMMTTPNVVFGVDAYPPAAKPTPPKHAEPPINTKAAESTAFVVLVTAATLIVIVLIILLVLKVKYRTDTNRYKIDVPKAYGPPAGHHDHQQQHPHHQQQQQQQLHQQHHDGVYHQNAGLLSPGNNYPPSRQSSSSPTYVPNNNNNDFRSHSGVIVKPKKRQDVKEWYV